MWRGAGRALLVEVVLGAVVLAVVVGGPSAGAVAVAVVIVGLAAGLVPLVDGRTLLGQARVRHRFRRRARLAALADPAPGVPEELRQVAHWSPGIDLVAARSASGTEMGVLCRDTSWTVMLGFEADDAVVAHGHDERIDLATLGDLSMHDDLVLAGVQLVTLTVPAPATALLWDDCAAVSSYRSLSDALGTRLPPTVRRSVLAIRLDPELCLDAVLRRGASEAGVHATLALGLHRVQALLKRQGLGTHPLDVAGVREAVSLMLGQGAVDNGPSTEAWRHLSCGGITHVGREVRIDDPRQASQTLQRLEDAVSQAPALFAVTALGLCAGGSVRGGVRLGCAGQSAAGRAATWLDADLAASLSDAAVLVPGAGRQVPALLATLPLGTVGAS